MAASSQTTSSAAATSPGRRREAIPNALTILRMLLAGVFVALLSLYHHPDSHVWTLPVATSVFIVATLTDALDGHLARAFNVLSDFGRIMDPLADKVLVIAAFILLAGPSFTAASDAQVSGVAPWMVAIILTRELLVTSLRGLLEARGVAFGAMWAGKAKMILQSVAVPIILLLVWKAPDADLAQGWARAAIDAIVWTTLLATLLSGAPYILRARAALAPNSASSKASAP